LEIQGKNMRILGIILDFVFWMSERAGISFEIGSLRVNIKLRSSKAIFDESKSCSVSHKPI
jgi:hypothetical protein